MTPYQQGLVHFKSGDYQLGLASFNEAIRNGHQPLEAAYYERSKCYEALGQIAKAQADLAHILTLPIDYILRHEVTDLITLLDYPEIKPFAAPYKIPSNITVTENEVELTITILTPIINKVLVVIGMFILYILVYVGLLFIRNYFLFWLIGGLGLAYIHYHALRILLNQITITVNDSRLTVSQSPLPYKFNFVEAAPSTINQIICIRESDRGASITESYVLLIEYLAKPLYGVEPLIKLRSYDSIHYIQWKLRERFNLSHQPSSGEYITPRKGKANLDKPRSQLNLYDFIQMVILFMMSLCILGYPGAIMASPGIACLINPNISCSMMMYTVFLSAFCVSLLSIGLPFSFVYAWFKRANAAQEIVDKGRITPGVVVYKNHREISHPRGRYHAYDVYYRYYGYEAIFNSDVAFDQFNIGDTIKVVYQADKPHISKPHYY